MRLLLHGGPIYAHGLPGADAMLVVDGVVAWIGPSSGAAVHAADADAVVDLAGAMVAPAFVDAHVHHTSTGLTLLGLDLRGTRSRQAVLEAVTQEARRVRGRPVVGHGWDESRWPLACLPTREELDRASWGSVVYLSRIDLHSAIVSTALVAVLPELAGTPGYEHSGRVTGDAHHLVRRFLTEQLPGKPARLRPARHPRACGGARRGGTPRGGRTGHQRGCGPARAAGAGGSGARSGARVVLGLA